MSPSRSTKRPQKPTRVRTHVPGVTAASWSRLSCSIFSICFLRERDVHTMNKMATAIRASMVRLFIKAGSLSMTVRRVERTLPV